MLEKTLFVAEVCDRDVFGVDKVLDNGMEPARGTFELRSY